MKLGKKLINLVICCFMFLSLFIDALILVKADDTEYVVSIEADGGLNVRSGPGTGYSKLVTLPQGYIANMVSSTVYSGSGCSAGWYHIYYSDNKTGYICALYAELEEKIVENTDGVPKNAFEKQLQEAGFPSSYWASLSALHEKYPNWKFEPLITNIKWDAAVKAESVVGKSLIQTSNYGYLSIDSGSYNFETDKFTVIEGSNWYAANSDVVAYYMDPRNFLNEKQIFMFEKLNYDASYQNIEAVEAVFGSTSYLKDNFQDFITAGSQYNINPIYLAARVRQETGVNGGTATSGASFTYNGKTYSGIYNVYNFGAYTGDNPVLAGLYWAASGTTYGRPWTSLSKSIIGGAEFLAGGYISKGQHTSYLQKFNVNPDSYWPVYTHQYMTNVQAVASEAVTSYNSYKTMDLLNSPFKFVIPVFIDMGERSELPDPGHPNNHLKELKVNGALVTGFEHDTYTYNFAVSEESKVASVEAVAYRSAAKISGTGNINLNKDTTTVTVSVTAENGTIQKYKINIIKTAGADLSVEEVISQTSVKSDGTYLHGLTLGTSLSTLQSIISEVSNLATISVVDKDGNSKSDESLVTGDVITIVNGVSKKTYTIVNFGDNDGDGKISVVDLLKVQKHILKYSTLSDGYFEASDVDNNGKIDVLDLLKIQKHILGYTEITQ